MTTIKSSTKFDSFFQVRKNVIYERAGFNRRNQQSGETAEQYIMALYDLVEHCNYGALKEEMIRDRLVVAIRDSALSEKLQMDAALTLESAKKAIRQREAIHEQQQVLKGGEKTTSDSSIDAIHPKRQINQRNRSYRNNRWDQVRDTQTSTQQPRNPQTGGKCSRCGRERHSREKCPARDVQCHNCKRKGHYSAQCLPEDCFNCSKRRHYRVSILRHSFERREECLDFQPHHGWQRGTVQVRHRSRGNSCFKGDMANSGKTSTPTTKQAPLRTSPATFSSFGSFLLSSLSQRTRNSTPSLRS